MVSWKLANIGSGNGLLPVGTKPLPEPMLTYCQLKFESNTKILIEENAFPNVVCKMVAILCRPQCVKLGLVLSSIKSLPELMVAKILDAIIVASPGHNGHNVNRANTTHKYVNFSKSADFYCIVIDIQHTYTTLQVVMLVEYSRRTELIPWLLKPWLVSSPSHHQPWYQLCRLIMGERERD